MMKTLKIIPLSIKETVSNFKKIKEMKVSQSEIVTNYIKPIVLHIAIIIK